MMEASRDCVTGLAGILNGGNGDTRKFRDKRQRLSSVQPVPPRRKEIDMHHFFSSSSAFDDFRQRIWRAVKHFYAF